MDAQQDKSVRLAGAPADTPVVKDHVLREVVNSLRDTALVYHAHGSLRERLRQCLDPLLISRAQRTTIDNAPATGIPAGGEVEKAADMLMAAAQCVVNDALEDAEDRVHICDRNNDDRKARAMPAPLQGLYYAVKAMQKAAPSQPSEAKAGEDA